MSDNLQRAIAAIRSGDKDAGKRLLAEVIRNDPHSETAWLWMSSIIDSDEHRRTCLERVLAINPHNETARQGLEALRRRPAEERPQVAQQSEPTPSTSYDALQTIRRLDPSDTKKCPYCAETIKAEAVVCRYCGRDLRAPIQTTLSPPTQTSSAGKLLTQSEVQAVPLQDVTNTIPHNLRGNLIDNEIAYHFAYVDVKGGCKSGRAAGRYVLISNKRVIYDAQVRDGDKYAQSSGAIPMDKVSFVGVSSSETKQGCNKRKISNLKISSGGGAIELAMPTVAEARRLQKVISEVQANQSLKP